ncbi:hypothetical protein EK21DRAFT_87829 [Setomelanomma holmii]|uniref:Uncharacterized protein n=1 Tax=Setomelanomma holmii TaxID=210430 RepID=A0A9P4LQG8_9PLEO|nr:hypothetical protein EK21DRAFT_87829 [Setomelanomma holmii]
MVIALQTLVELAEWSDHFASVKTQNNYNQIRLHYGGFAAEPSLGLPTWLLTSKTIVKQGTRQLCDHSTRTWLVADQYMYMEIREWLLIDVAAPTSFGLEIESGGSNVHNTEPRIALQLNSNMRRLSVSTLYTKSAWFNAAVHPSPWTIELPSFDFDFDFPHLKQMVVRVAIHEQWMPERLVPRLRRTVEADARYWAMQRLDEKIKMEITLEAGSWVLVGSQGALHVTQKRSMPFTALDAALQSCRIMSRKIGQCMKPDGQECVQRDALLLSVFTMTLIDMPVFPVGIKMVPAKDYDFYLSRITTFDSPDVQTDLQQAFRTKVLDEIYEHLWRVATGLHSHIDALHVQAMKGRQILAAENPALHLVWYNDIIFIKALSPVLLVEEFWSTYLTNQTSLAAFENKQRILGFLCTCALLIKTRLDFQLARKAGFATTELFSSSYSPFCLYFLLRWKSRHNLMECAISCCVLM